MFVSLSSATHKGAALAITDNQRDQIVVRFIPYGDEHVTIHKDKSGQLLKTHWTKDKPRSVWDDEVVQAARAENYADPEKHKGYIVHAPFTQKGLFKLGEHIVSRLFKLSDLSLKAKYMKTATDISIGKNAVMLGFYFSPTKAEAGVPNVLLEHETSLGWLYLTDERP